MQQPENQEQVLEFGFRPGNPDGRRRRARSTRANGVDPDQPQTLLEVPEPDGAGRAPRRLGRAAQGGPGAARHRRLGLDGRRRPTRTPATTKLDLAKQAAIDALDQFKDDDEVGLWVFTTDLGRNEPDRLPSTSCRSARSAAQRESSRRRSTRLVPLNGTPLYAVTGDAYDDACSTDVRPDADQRRRAAHRRRQRGPAATTTSTALLDTLRTRQRGRRPPQPVRIFPIAYGDDADLATLRQHRRGHQRAPPTTPATRRTINKVFTAVVSNF